MQWRVLREERLAAARDGKRIKEALERALALDPGLDDAYFGIGMYRYYADVAPTAAKILQVSAAAARRRPREGPGADAAGARTAGGCSRARPTTSCTSSISGTSTRPIARSSCCAICDSASSGNPLFLTQIAEIQDVYQHDIMASLDSWRALLAEARAARQRRRRWPRCGRGWASRVISTRSR